MVSELLPPTLCMRVGLTVLNGQRSIQEKNSLLGPFCEVSMRRCFCNVFERDEIFVHIFERRRWGNWLENTEAESMSLIGLMIGVLSNNDNFDTGNRGGSEGIEDILPGECIPLEYNIVFLNGVSFNKGCYIGQELVARTRHTGVIRKRLMPVYIDNYQELSKSFENKNNNLTIINEETKRRAGKLCASIKQNGIALIRLNEWKNRLRIQNADVPIIPSIPNWWPSLDEATKLEMQIDRT